jgi:hypothetical protein
MGMASMNRFGRRIASTMFLVPAGYEEVEHDGPATAQAVLVVLVFSIAAGFGTSGVEGFSAGALVGGAVAALSGWAAWAVLIYLIGVHVLPEPQTRADAGELLRTTGFAMSPGWLLALGALPVVRPAVFVLVPLWLLAAMVIGVRQALDFTSTLRALAVCAIGWALALALAFGISLATAPAVH